MYKWVCDTYSMVIKDLTNARIMLSIEHKYYCAFITSATCERVTSRKLGHRAASNIFSGIPTILYNMHACFHVRLLLRQHHIPIIRVFKQDNSE